jgi:serine protease Do
MSGGPVFNEAGHVIGLVSTGFSRLDEDAIATATYFSAWSVPSQYLPSIDADNPGHIFGFAVLDENDNVVRFWPNRDQLADWANENGLSPPMWVGFNPATGEWCSR